MKYDELKARLLRRANGLRGSFSEKLQVRENRTAKEIQDIALAILNQARVDGFVEHDLVMLWDAFVDVSRDWVEDPTRVASSLGITCSPNLEVAEYALVVGLIFSQIAESHLQSKSPKRHLIAAHLLIAAIEFNEYWYLFRGSTKCRIPDERFSKTEEMLDRKTKEFWLRDNMRERFQPIREKGVEAKKKKAQSVHDAIAKINADLLSKPANEGWKVDVRAKYIAEKVGRSESYVRKLIATTRKTKQT